ncbi:MAG: hypothetical protein QG608_3014 [Actinomycetota bacterium]|nr:hypothetical protein [Actinomycetota bacterium]
MARPSTPREFRRFADGRSGIVPEVVDTLVELKKDHLQDPDPAHWSEGDLTSLLVELFPRKVVTDREWLAAAVPTARLYLEFLQDRGLLCCDGCSPDTLRAELDSLESAFLGACKDPEGLALNRAAFRAVDAFDLGTRQGFWTSLGTCPEEQLRLLPAVVPDPEPLSEDGFLSPDPQPVGPGLPFLPVQPPPRVHDRPTMPPIRLQPLSDLARAARRASLLRALDNLARWVDPRQHLTSRGVLRPAEAVEVCRVLGLPQVPGWRSDLRAPVENPPGQRVRLKVIEGGCGLGGSWGIDGSWGFDGSWGIDEGRGFDGSWTADEPRPDVEDAPESPPRAGEEPAPHSPGAERGVRCAHDLSELHRLWELALETDWLVVIQAIACPGRARTLWEQGDDDAALHVWNTVFTEALEWGLDTEANDRLERSVDPDVLGIVNHTVVDALMAGYVGVPTSMREFRRTLRVRLRDFTSCSQDLVQAVAMRRLGRHLDQLEELGAAVRREGCLVLTPLGRWGMRELLMSAGFHTPAVGDISGADALTMLTQVSRLAASDSEPAVGEWIAVRDPQEAVDALLEAARAGSAMIRLACLSVLDEHLPEHVAPVLRSLVDDPLLGLHARSWLAHRAGEGLADFTDEQVQWLAVETIAGMLDGVGPGVSYEDLPEDAWTAAEQTAQLDTISQCRHPQILEVLDAIGSGHPRGQVRRAATRAAFRIRQHRAFRTGR